MNFGFLENWKKLTVVFDWIIKWMNMKRLLGLQGPIMAGHLKGLCSKYFAFGVRYAILGIKKNPKRNYFSPINR